MGMNIEQARETGSESYRCWVYNRVDSEIVGKVVNLEQADELLKEGWQLSPACFSEDKQLDGNIEFESAVDDRVADRNRLLHLDKILTKNELEGLVQRYFNVDLDKRKKLTQMKEETKGLMSLDREDWG